MSNYIWNFFIIKVWLKRSDEVAIRENVNNIDKRFEEKNYGNKNMGFW